MNRRIKSSRTKLEKKKIIKILKRKRIYNYKQ